jgi:uncharacterized membrane protein YecN with MAPEG domain
MPTLHVPIISAATAAVLLFLQMLLAFGVVLQRRGSRQSLGDGNNPALLRAIRRHGNLAENAAIFIIALTLYELLGADLKSVEIIAGVLVVARLIHAIGLSFSRTTNIFRVVGAATTVILGLVLAVRLGLLVYPLLPIR